MKRAIPIILILCFPLVASAATIHVPGDQPTILDGMVHASHGDTVLVADGTYQGPGNKDLRFFGKIITVRSENGAEHCIIDCENNGRGFFFEDYESALSIVQGFTIQNGHVTGGGAGIYCGYHSSPTISGCIITGNKVDGVTGYGGGIYCYYSQPIITNNIISGNEAWYGAGIGCYHASPTISSNTISENSASGSGGGVFYNDCRATILNNTISENQALSGGGIGCFFYTKVVISNNFIHGNLAANGGGIHCWPYDRSTIIGNTITGNQAENGGAIYCNHLSTPDIINNIITENGSHNGGGIYLTDGGTMTIRNNTLTRNSANAGGAIHCSDSAYMVILNTVLWENEAVAGKEIYIGAGGTADPSTVTIDYSDVEGGQGSVHIEPDCTLDWGTAMIVADPILVSGPLGDFYLSQVAAGQPEDSPCVNAGDPASEMIVGTTRTDSVQDSGIVDMGFHYPPKSRLLIGPGPAYWNPPLVRVVPPIQDAVLEYTFEAYDPDHYGVNLTCGDVTGDLLDEIITGAGPGEMYGPHVRGFALDGTPLPGLSFLAYGTNKYGVNVAAGDIDGDGFDEIITGAGPGAVFGPHVRGWDYDGTPGVEPIAEVNYFAYGTPKWGVNVSAGDIDGDGYDEIVTGAGPGAVYGPHVRGWNVDGGTAAAIPGVSYLAYGTKRMGVNVTCGDVDGDGIDEIVTGPGPSSFFGAHVRGWNCDGSAVTPMTSISFFAWSSDDVRYGANVFAGSDLNNDGRDELIVGGGPDRSVGTPVKLYTYDGSQCTEWIAFEAYSDMMLTHGVNVAATRN